MTNKNKLNLEQILDVVKEKYQNLKIEPVIEAVSTIGIGMDMRGEPIPVEEPAYNHVADSIIGTPFEILYNGNLRVNGINIENIIELKHNLGIEIKWKDLTDIHSNYKKYVYYEFVEIEKVRFYENGTIEISEGTITTNRSYWQMYNIIKNLTE